VSTLAKTKRLELTRLGFACGLLFLSITVLVSFVAHRTGNRYVTFGTLWASGRAAIDGLDPYGAYPATYRGKVAGQGPANYPDLNLNPPWTLPFIQGLSYLSLARFTQVWTLLTGLCFLAGCVILIREQPKLQGRQIIWLSLCAPTLMTLVSGQVYGWAFLLGVLAWSFHRRGYWLATGIAIGCAVAIRPTMGFWLLFLFLRGYRKIAAVAAGTIMTLFALPLLIYGMEIYSEWLNAFAGDKHGLDPVNIAIMPFCRRHGHPYWGIGIAILIALCVGWWIAKKRPDFTAVSGAALCVGMLSGPLAWMHYVLFAAPFFMARRWTMLSTAGACLLLMIPLPAPALGLLYLAGTFFILAFFIFPNSYPGRRHDLGTKQTRD
jgi:hypothetical protein